MAKRSYRQKLGRDFYMLDTVSLAKALLGKYLVRMTPEGTCSGMIVETEAYGGVMDQASHVYGSRFTERTKIWLAPGGYAYVYTIYGIYHCLGITAGNKHEPGAVLIRALTPADGLSLMYQRRRVEASDRNAALRLCSGPSKICQSFAIDKTLYGENLCEDVLFIEDRGTAVAEAATGASPRIGIQYAGEAVHYPWRFFIRGSPYLSGKA